MIVEIGMNGQVDCFKRKCDMHKNVKWFHLFFLVQFLLIGYLVLDGKRSKRSLLQFEKKTLKILRRCEVLCYDTLYEIEQSKGALEFPFPIQHVPFADEEGIVLSVHNVSVPGVEAPYNASLIEKGDDYLLFFRADVPALETDATPYYTRIGSIELNKNFQPIESDVTWMDVESLYPEDPRIVRSGDEFFIVYNDAVQNRQFRDMYIANVNLEEREVNYVTRLKRGLHSVEKNWMPFSPDGKGLHFVYSISPHEILSVSEPSKGGLNLVADRVEQSVLSQSDWPLQWGTLRGGTPPLLVDGEYLTFFHSAIKDRKGVVWYLMGAYTFETTAPYKITRISPHPLLFNGIYESPYLATANRQIRCIYPAGFVVENREGRELIQLSCGENDSAVKIITLDKEALLKSLKEVK